MTRGLPEHRLALETVHDAARTIDPVFLQSPQYACEPLQDALGVAVSLKVESINPIRCFKGRGADYLVARRASDAPLVTASAGNFGQAMAYACRTHGVPLTVYAAVTANPLKLDRMRALGAEVILAGVDFDAAKEVARAAAAVSGARFVEDGRDLETLAGAGTIALEWLAGPRFDVALIPLGNGALLNGIARVLKAAWPDVRVVAVQAAGAPAMVRSWRTRHLVAYDRIETIADGIGVRTPIQEAVEDMQGWVDDAILVQEESIIQAMRLVHRHAGLVAEPSAVVGIAALIEHQLAFAHARVATVLCGGNLTDEQVARWLCG